VGKARCCQGHGDVHQDETTWCQDAKANSYCFVTLSWFYHKFHVFYKKNTFNKEIFIKNHHYYLQCEKVLERVFFAYFEYHQIWLNIFMDDCHNITKLKIK